MLLLLLIRAWQRQAWIRLRQRQANIGALWALTEGKPSSPGHVMRQKSLPDNVVTAGELSSVRIWQRAGVSACNMPAHIGGRGWGKDHRSRCKGNDLPLTRHTAVATATREQREVRRKTPIHKILTCKHTLAACYLLVHPVYRSQRSTFPLYRPQGLSDLRHASFPTGQQILITRTTCAVTWPPDTDLPIIGLKTLSDQYLSASKSRKHFRRFA